MFTSVPPANPVIGETYIPTATGGPSGKPVTFTATGSCTLDIDGRVVTFTRVGDCIITADQAGNADHPAAQQQKQVITVGRDSPEFGSSIGGLFGSS